jgi:hypothetical protein
LSLKIVENVQKIVITTLTSGPLDVRPAFCGREPGPVLAHLEAAEGEGAGHHRLVHATVPGVRQPRQEEDPDVPQVVQESIL